MAGRGAVVWESQASCKKGGSYWGFPLEQTFKTLPLHAWLTKCSLNLKSKLLSGALGVLTFWAKLSDI